MASPGCVREPHLERPAWVFAAGPVVGNVGPRLSQSVVQAASKRGVIFVPLAAFGGPSVSDGAWPPQMPPAREGQMRENGASVQAGAPTLPSLPSACD